MLLLLDPTPPSPTPATSSCFSLPLGESAIKTTGPMRSIFLAISLSMTLIARGFCGSLCPWRIRRARRRSLLYGRLENASGIEIILEFIKLFMSLNGALKLLVWSLLSQDEAIRRVQLSNSPHRDSFLVIRFMILVLTR